MKELPILFSGPMVKAILEGRKLQTRRVIKPQPLKSYLPGSDFIKHLQRIPKHTVKVQDADNSNFVHVIPAPRYQVGDHLWVKETYQEWCPVWDGAWCGCGTKEMQWQTHGIIYRADNFVRPPASNAEKMLKCLPPLKWKSGWFMSKKYARLWLEVTEVRAERLQEISTSDAGDEGADQMPPYPFVGIRDGTARIGAFQRYWDSINGKTHPWESNPWCFVYTFRRIGI